MSPLSGFLIFVVSLTGIVIAYLTKQFQEENVIYSKKIQKNKSISKSKTLEKEKVVAETLNGRLAMIGLVAAFGAYLTTGEIIPGLV